MDPSLKNYSLNIPSSPSVLDLCNFSLISEESDRIFSQVNELKAQLDIVNEDRQRLKKENEKLRTEKNSEFSKLLASQKALENEKVNLMKEEIARLKKECEEKDNLLNTMRNLLGNSGLMKENAEIRTKKAFLATGNQSRLPGTRALMKTNRSISPYTKCV